MTTLKFIPVFLLIVLYSCKQNAATHKVHPAAVELNKKAMTLVVFIHNADSSKKAISLLDKATAIDSNYYLGYYNKLMFFDQLKQFNRAILTINKLIQLRPNAYDLYYLGGILYERIDDSISSKPYFEKSLINCNAVLDTMGKTNNDYEMLVSFKAVNLIMLGQEVKAHELLQKLYDSQPDPEHKKMMLPLMNKSRKELLAQLREEN